MRPQDAVRDVTEHIERITGYPLHIQPEKTLQVMATIKAPEPNIPFTLLRIRPDLTGMREYVICHQCCFVIRQASLPKSAQWTVRSSPKGRIETALLVGEAMPQLLRSDAEAFSASLLNGLITHLRSVPVGLRIDNWLKIEYPVLREQQKLSIQKQLRENVSVLSPNVRQTVPEKIYQATASINAAFAKYWSSEWEDNTVLVPYKASGHLNTANNLCRILSATSDTPEFDRTLIELWAQELVISEWCHFA